MINKLYAHNFRCLVNFELDLSVTPSALLIGKNGTGKSSVGAILEIFQSIGRGSNRVGDLVDQKDFNANQTDAPMAFELQVNIAGKDYIYTLVLELPDNFTELRVLEEKLICAGERVYERETSQVALHTDNAEAKFLLDWHLIALPVIQQHSGKDPIAQFKTWLSRMVILAPIPALITGDSSKKNLFPKKDGSNFGEWFSGLLSQYPAAYTNIDDYIRSIMPDLQDILNEPAGKGADSLVIRFSKDQQTLKVAFSDLSDGEKCFFIGAVIIAANAAYGPLFCFWDEPDNYLSISEVSHFIVALRRSFQERSQILVTSHHAEAIQRFSGDNTFVLQREGHLAPTRCKLLEDIPLKRDLINALILGDVEG